MCLYDSTPCRAHTSAQIDIVESLGLRNAVRVVESFDRPNLSFDVVGIDGAGTKARKGALLSLALSDPSMRPATIASIVRGPYRGPRALSGGELSGRAVAAAG